jgi:general secretion pathway protein B
MSILLDALKKSETQRQLGKTPTIHTAVEAPDAERETEQQWIALSMLALSAVAIAWFGWQQFREPVVTLDEAGVAVVAIPRVEETQAPIDELVQGGMERTPAGSAEEARERREKLSQSFNSYEAEKDTATDKEAKLSPTTVVKTSSDPATAQPAKNQSHVAEEAPLATPARRSSRPQPHEPEPISFWQVPQALRDGLPEFRINVLVYAEKPEDRFLLINGQRLVEKEELADGVVLDEIRRDGAVFRYRNYRFLVKD